MRKYLVAVNKKRHSVCVYRSKDNDVGWFNAINSSFLDSVHLCAAEGGDQQEAPGSQSF